MDTKNVGGNVTGGTGVQNLMNLVNLITPLINMGGNQQAFLAIWSLFAPIYANLIVEGEVDHTEAFNQAYGYVTQVLTQFNTISAGQATRAA